MHLHNHSAYSIVDGRARISDYVKLAVADGQKSFALTDHGTLAGTIEAYQECHKAGLNFIPGIELYVDAYELEEKNFPGHLTVLAKNESGYRSLIALNNLAARQFHYRPRVTLKQIIDGGYAENLIILSGCQSSPIHNVDFASAENIVQELAKVCGGFFLEFMKHGSKDDAFEEKQYAYLERVSALHKSTGIPLVITNDCHYAHKYDEEIHQDLMNNSHGEKSGLEFDGTGFYFRSIKQMEYLARELGAPEAVDNAISIGEMCNVTIPEADKVNWYVPDITGGRPRETIEAICRPNLQGKEAEYTERYEAEMAVLSTSPAILNSYLVAHDVIQWCHSNGIPAAARGSMAGSLVSHLLGITTEDPVKYRLSFNRAVNPARPTIPDFDLDVGSLRRGEVIDYLKEKFQNLIPVSSYTHYGPKGSFRKVMRMEGLLNPTEINMMTKELPDDWTGEDDFEYSPTQHKWIGNAPWTEHVPEEKQGYVAIFRGLYSSFSAHPCGILVAGTERPIEHEVPFSWVASSKQLVSAFDMYTLKKVGLFKLDLLGLRTLDQLAYMERVSGAKVPDDDYNDPKVLAAFGADLLAGVFQMDGWACRSVLREICGAQSFEDIIAANTLARPGAAQFTSDYRGGSTRLLAEYPQLQATLGPTNGLILYQEQVMEIAGVLADFDDAEQDDIKESIKYFRKENWTANIEPKFRERCAAKGIDASNILEAISRMASYTYNRAHAMTYSAYAYKMMWYKIYHPVVYYAAVFDAYEDKSRLVLESHFFDVKWNPPDINESQGETIIKDGEILLGLQSVKRVGAAAYEAIRKVRKDGPIHNLEDFMERVEKRRCNIQVVTALKDAFAFDKVGESGNYQAFAESFGFQYQFLDKEPSKYLSNWMVLNPQERLGGYVASVSEKEVKNGASKGKKFGVATITNITCSKTAIFWPEVWHKARSCVYSGAAVQLFGEVNLKGEFIVTTGGEI